VDRWPPRALAAQQPGHTMPGVAQRTFARFARQPRRGYGRRQARAAAFVGAPRAFPRREQILEQVLAKLQRRITRQRAKLAFRDSNFHLENLYKHVAIFPDSGLAYNRIKKCANTRIAAFFTDILSGETFDNSLAMKRGLVKPADLSYAELMRIRAYYSVVFVRNPYGRVLSVFLDKLAAGGQSRARTYGRCPGFGDNSREGFLAFLEYLDSGGLHDNLHWWPQSELLYQPPADFSFIGRLERTVPDMRQILAAIGQDPDLAVALDAPHALEAKRKQAVTAASSRVDDYYTDRGRDIVRQLYSADFDNFDYQK
jgi:hypothetical protein